MRGENGPRKMRETNKILKCPVVLSVKKIKYTTILFSRNSSVL